MKKTSIIIIGALLMAASSALAGTPDGASGPWADEVVSFSQGLRKNGTPVVTERSDPSQALGAAEGDDTINFVALGFGGELVLKFDNCILNGEDNDIDVVETSFGSPGCAAYPETVRIYASKDGSVWEDLGTSCLDGACDLGSLDCAQYIRFVDESDTADFNSTADGFDIDGVMALHSAEECPAEEEPADQVDEGNTACVVNKQFVLTNTGGNGIANSKSFGGDSKAKDNEGNTIITGDAWSEARSITIANSNIKRDCCEGNQINVANMAHVMNLQVSVANTGLNGIANSKAAGGDSKTYNNDGNVILTGNALSSASAFNLANSNIKREFSLR